MKVKVCHRLWVSFLQKGAFLCLFLCCAFYAHAQQPIVFHNKGSIITVKPNTLFIINSAADTGRFVNGGYFNNESRIVIEGYFINQAAGDTAVGIDTAGFLLTRDWTNNGVFIAGQSTVTLNGDNQVIKGTVPTPFHHLTLTGTGIKSLQQDASSSGLLNLNDLELATDTQTFTVANTDSAAITRTTGFVSSEHGGTLERVMDNDTTEYFYPLGSAIGTFRFRPLVLTLSDSSLNTLGARLANVDATSENYDRSNRSSDICSINPNFYHQIERTQGASPVNITMFYDAAEDGFLWSEISQWQDTLRWELTDFSVQAVDTQFTSLTLEDWDDFSQTPFALMVPVTLIDTNATVINHVSCNGGSDGSICVSDPPVAGTAPFRYLWSTSPNDTLSCVTGLSAGVYTLYVSDSSQCPTEYTFTVDEPGPIVIDTAVTPVTCKDSSDGSICLIPTGDFPPFTYQWAIGGNPDSCKTGLFKSTYAATVTDATGCTASIFVTVTEPDELVAVIQGIDVTCFGFGDGQAIATPQGGTDPFFYQWSTPDSAETETATELIPGSYTVTVTDSNDCTATGSVIINQPDTLIVTAGDDVTVFEGSSATLTVADVSGGNGDESYQWTPADDVTDPQSPSTSASPDATTIYTIMVTDSNGCIAVDTLVVQVDVNYYTFPDGFVPNGNNSIFFPVISSTVSVTKLEIFNRWGQLVSNDPTGWDGKYKGELQPMDTYVYQAVLLLPDGTQRTEQGDFILIW